MQTAPITFASSKTVTAAASAFEANASRMSYGVAGGLHAGGLDGRRPFALAEVVEVERSAFGRRVQERRVEARRQSVERGERAAGERHVAHAVLRLAAGHDARVDALLLDAHEPAAAVDVAALERGPFFRPQPGRGAEVGQRLVGGRELGAPE
jgi:hypothetical protein